jgi:hypothetical protein
MYCALDEAPDEARVRLHRSLRMHLQQTCTSCRVAVDLLPPRRVTHV